MKPLEAHLRKSPFSSHIWLNLICFFPGSSTEQRKNRERSIFLCQNHHFHGLVSSHLSSSNQSICPGLDHPLFLGPASRICDQCRRSEFNALQLPSWNSSHFNLWICALRSEVWWDNEVCTRSLEPWCRWGLAFCHASASPGQMPRHLLSCSSQQLPWGLHSQQGACAWVQGRLGLGVHPRCPAGWSCEVFTLPREHSIEE